MKKIEDEFTPMAGMVSRQRLWQLRQAKKGLCAICGKPALCAGYCLAHLVMRRENGRRRHGSVRRYRSGSYRLEAEHGHQSS